MVLVVGAGSTGLDGPRQLDSRLGSQLGGRGLRDSMGSTRRKQSQTWLKALKQIPFSNSGGLEESSRAFSLGLHRGDGACKRENEGVGMGSKQGLTQSQGCERSPQVGRKGGRRKCDTPGCLLT